MFLRFRWAHITVIWSVCNMPQHCAVTRCCYLTGETWWIRSFSLNLALTGLHKELLSLPCVPMFILYPFRSAFGSLGRFLLSPKSPYRLFWFTNSGGSIQVWALEKLQVVFKHCIEPEYKSCLLTHAEACAISSLFVIPKYWHMLPSYLQFLVCAQVWTCKGLLGTQWE